MIYLQTLSSLSLPPGSGVTHHVMWELATEPAGNPVNAVAAGNLDQCSECPEITILLCVCNNKCNINTVGELGYSWNQRAWFLLQS